MKRNYIFIVLIGLIVIVLCTLLILKNLEKKTINPINPNPIDVNTTNEFDYKMIKETQSLYKDKNYMISPLSIAYALSMVNDGAKDETYNQISTLLGNYKIDSTIDIKDKIGIANLIFISNKYKSDINNDYIKLIQTKYSSDVLFDNFKTPNPVNDWVNKKTFNMIKNPISYIDPDFVLGLANAIAIDVEWKDKFECDKTSSSEFTKEDKTKMNAAMMHSTNDITYIESANAKGIIKDYAIYDKTTGKIVSEENENTVALEYIAILPNTNVDDYIKLFDKNELSTLLNNKKEPNGKLDIHVSLPKYTYDFNYDRFKESLINLGMKDAFVPEIANFKGMINDNSTLGIYINQAIHKSHIELSENGTKAAAVTILMMYKNTSFEPEEKETINIEFNKPFIYLIKEKKSDNIWFFGTVYEPMKWEDNDSYNCKNEY